MIINTSTNVYWVGTIKNIYTDKMKSNNMDYSVLKCYGRCSVEDSSKAGGVHVMKQDLTIFAMSGLSLYVESELEIGDEVFIVGRIVSKQKCKGSVFYYEQCIQAEQIYKAEWQKYYVK